MKKSLFKIMLLSLISINLSASEVTIESMNEHIKQTTYIPLKQVLICERDTFTVLNNDTANPNECLKAVEYFKNINETDTEIESIVQGYVWDKGVINASNPYNKTMYKFYLEEYKKRKITESYLNAGVLYQYSKKNQNDKKAFEMYKKAYDNGDCTIFDCSSAVNLGYFYIVGRGVDKNLILGYKYTKEAAEKGASIASKNLERLCSETPWACK